MDANSANDSPKIKLIENYDHRFVCVTIKLDKAKVRMSGYWKFNTSKMDEKDFQDQLEQMLKWELMGAIIKNS